MALNKKLSRAIHLDGVDYRYRICCIHAPDLFQVTIQRAFGTGQKLQIQYSSDAGENASITPRMIANAMRVGLDTGWQPTQHALGEHLVKFDEEAPRSVWHATRHTMWAPIEDA